MRWVNSLAPGKFEWNFRYLIFQIISVIDGWGISCEIGPRWMSFDLTDYKSTLVQVIVWYRQARSHYLSQCWPRSQSPYGVTRPQWVHCGWVTRKWYMCWEIESTLAYNGLALGKLQATIITNEDWSPIAPNLWIIFKRNSVKIPSFSLKKISLKLSSPICCHLWPSERWVKPRETSGAGRRINIGEALIVGNLQQIREVTLIGRRDQ